ncbi:hypothetical protein PINS_up020480 [Pythium insidiosum]|nr:hypothetical protein PINS_up020480 [Pythium insidiosum]
MQTATTATRRPRHKKECNDVFFLLVFLALVGVTLYFAGAYGRDFDSGFRVMLQLIGTSAAAAMGMSLVWIGVMILLIWVALVAIIALNIAAAVFLTKQGLRPRLARIKFAAAHLKVAGHAVFRLPMTLVVALVMVAVHNYVQLDDLCTQQKCDVKTKTGAVLGVLFGMLVIFFWGSFVLKNVIAVTTAGTVAAWKNASNSGVHYGRRLAARHDAQPRLDLLRLAHRRDPRGDAHDPQHPLVARERERQLRGRVPLLVHRVPHWLHRGLDRVLQPLCVHLHHGEQARLQALQEQGLERHRQRRPHQQRLLPRNVIIGAITAYIAVKMMPQQGTADYEKIADV